MTTWEEIANYTDEDCIKHASEISVINPKEIRNFAKKAIEANYRALFYKSLIKEGLFYAYSIKCPNCGIIYTVQPSELNINQVKCMDCGYFYHQIDNIDGFSTLDVPKFKEIEQYLQYTDLK